ncbi:MAG: hypothetical protein CL781_00945 [Chloroflexi bacterium]|nr:hypothetical protein [Chloroflexota bacterium]|tara:strand:- start:1911 stop:2228 length:318 start_codon:yes stop_codon:yes gene_type:complete
MPIYEYLCNDCEAFFEIFFKSFGNTSGTKCPGCSSESVERKISSVSFKIDSSLNMSNSDSYYSDRSNIGKHVESSFAKNGLEMPETVRKTIENARSGKMPDNLDI